MTTLKESNEILFLKKNLLKMVYKHPKLMQSGHLKFFCSQANHYCIISQSSTPNVSPMT